MTASAPESRQTWGTRTGVILAVIGSAVGLGNFLRFPGVAAANGGGAFMIPYVVAFVVVGLPIAWVEWSMGRYGGRKGFNSAAGIYRAACGGRSGPAYCGVLALLIPVIIYMYYLSVEAWCLGYAWHYWSGGMSHTVSTAMQTAAEADPSLTNAELHAAGVSAANSYLVDFAGMDGDFNILRRFASGAAPFILICFVLNFLLIWRGLNKGIEWFCRWAMPALIVCSLIILVRVLTLGDPQGAQQQVVYHPASELADHQRAPDLPDITVEGLGTLAPTTVTGTVDSGLGFMWNPVGHRLVEGNPVDGGEPIRVVTAVGFWQALLTPSTWLAAAGQIFFSLSVGLGVILTYASYSRRRDDIALSSLTAATGNGFFEVALAGMMVLPAAFIFVPIGQIVDAGERASSLSLGFFALPGVFENMPAGHFFGGLFFFLLFLAAVTSSLSMLQPAIAFLEEGLGLRRHASVAILGVLTGIGAGFVALISTGATVLDHMDFWITNFAIFIMALIQVILFSWVVGADKGLKELADGAQMPIPRWLKPMLTYVTPTFLLVIFISWIWTQATSDHSSKYFDALRSNPVVQGTIAFMILVALFFLLLIHEAIQRWKRQDAVHQGAQP